MYKYQLSNVINLSYTTEALGFVLGKERQYNALINIKALILDLLNSLFKSLVMSTSCINLLQIHKRMIKAYTACIWSLKHAYGVIDMNITMHTDTHKLSFHNNFFLNFYKLTNQSQSEYSGPTPLCFITD